MASSVSMALAAALLWTACEEFENEGAVSDDELNGRQEAQADQENAASSATSESANRTEASPVAEASTSSSSSASSSGASSSSTQESSSSSGSQTGAANTSGEIGAIHWVGKNISGWPVTTTLRASVNGGTVKLDYDKKNTWPVVDAVCANAWAIVNIGGTWYAGTFEYMRPGQTSKGAYALDGSRGDHFKAAPLSSWRPQSGEVFGLMVSGLCRGGLSNVKERSNICIVRWP